MALKIPKGERSMVRYFTQSGDEKFLLTQKDVSGFPNFYLYKIDGDQLTKLGSGRNPLELEEKIDVERSIRNG